MADTVRTVTALLTTLFQNGQAADSITPQDMRDLIVSLAIQNGDFSDLPTDPTGLAVGRIWVNGNTLQIVQ